MMRVLLPFWPQFTASGVLAVFLLSVVAVAVVAVLLFNKGKRQ
jgi:hypothetical protein